MRNADMPAMPVVVPSELACDPQSGLTKREMMAMHAMTGLLASGATYNGRTDARDLLSADAVAHADALLAELERTK